jgi:hypothetical protein
MSLLHIILSTFFVTCEASDCLGNSLRVARRLWIVSDISFLHLEIWRNWRYPEAVMVFYMLLFLLVSPFCLAFSWLLRTFCSVEFISNYFPFFLDFFENDNHGNLAFFERGMFFRCAINLENHGRFCATIPFWEMLWDDYKFEFPSDVNARFLAICDRADRIGREFSDYDPATRFFPASFDFDE